MEINLIPWRALLREKQARQRHMIGKILTISIVFFIILGNYYLNNQCQRVLRSLLQLQSIMKKMDAIVNPIIKLNEEKIQYAITQKLLTTIINNKKIYADFFSQMNSIPKEIHCENIETDNEKLIITGFAPSMISLTNFIDIFNHNKNFSKIATIILPSENLVTDIHFKITLSSSIKNL